MSAFFSDTFTGLATMIVLALCWIIARQLLSRATAIPIATEQQIRNSEAWMRFNIRQYEGYDPSAGPKGPLP